MFFYQINSYLNRIIKFGITAIMPIHRYNWFEEMDVEAKMHAVAYFPNISVQELSDINKKCIVATKQYSLHLKEKPNNSNRYGVEPHIIWDICKKYFPPNAIIYDKHDDILKLKKSEHMIKDIQTDKQFIDPQYFASIGELESYEL
jgi:hypothetical protein